MGLRWKLARREHDADIIATEVLPVLKDIEANEE
jgi:hypothetical protein